MLCFRSSRACRRSTLKTSGGCARGDLNRAQPTLVLPELASLSVKLPPVDSRLIQLGRGTCHTLWHRLDLDFASDESFTGRLSAYTCGSTASTACTSASAGPCWPRPGARDDLGVRMTLKPSCDGCGGWAGVDGGGELLVLAP